MEDSEQLTEQEPIDDEEQLEPVYENPLYEFAKESGLSVKPNRKLCLRYASILKEFSQRPINISSRIAEHDVGGLTMPEEFGWIPALWAKTFVSSSLNDEKGYRKILEFSNNFIYEIGSGSGYNAKVLQKMGCEVYPTDVSSTYFPESFTDIDWDKPNEEHIKDVAGY
jgi:hypothetical protein